jgi:hypothetical protein
MSNLSRSLNSSSSGWLDIEHLVQKVSEELKVVS